MAEQTYELKPVGVRYVCDKCGEGEMQRNGIVLTAYPPRYMHACSKCGHRQAFTEVYPSIRWVSA